MWSRAFPPRANSSAPERSWLASIAMSLQRAKKRRVACAFCKAVASLMTPFAAPSQWTMATNAGHASTEKPWLRNAQWASRTLVDQRRLGWQVLLLAYLVGALILAAVGAALLEDSNGKLLGLLALAIFVVGILALLTRIALRRFRYGDTVCHLVTL